MKRPQLFAALASLGLAAVFVLVPPACGVLSGNAKCDLRKSLTIKAGYCWDLENGGAALATADQTICVELAGTWDSGLCDHGSAIGACQKAVDGGGKETRWFYADGKYPTANAIASAGECKSDETLVDGKGTSLAGTDLAWTPPDATVPRDLAGGSPVDLAMASVDSGPPTLGKGNCEPRVQAGVCDNAHMYAYNCSAGMDKSAPEASCVVGTGPLGAQFQCCPDALCQRTPVYDPVCAGGGTPSSYTCYAGATPPASCVLKLPGVVTSYCCP